ncbi:MAG TPA: GNAT family N-acetyltransferase [Stellaceae bacterium]|nr:GNAT family N-acetyltransferase [Stellaceae bacterium]
MIGEAPWTSASAPRADANGRAARVRVRMPTADDIPRLVALINELAQDSGLLFINAVDPKTGASVLRDHLASIALSGTEAVFVADQGDALVALLTATRGAHEAKRGVVDIGIGVRQGERGRGIGGALLEAAEHWARSVGVHRLQLTVVTTNAPAIALYRKLGYVNEGVMHASAKLDGVYLDQYMMAKLLPG